MAYALLAGAGAPHGILCLVRSSCATASYCLAGSLIGSVCLKWLIQAVPVYSQYMSMLPEVNAARTTLLPCSPHFSLTVAPVDCRARLVMWQRMSCSGNSLDPTVKVAPFSEAILAGRPPLAVLALVWLLPPA